MTRGQAIKKLRREGYRASVGRIRWALRTGQVEPLPIKAARGAYDFERSHLKQLRAYFVRSFPGPQPLFAEKFPIRGPNDRLHQLARKKQRLRDRGPSERALRERRKEDTDATIQLLERIARELDSECFEGALPAPSSGAEQ